MKKKGIIIISSVLMVAFLVIAFMVSTGLRKRPDVVLFDYVVAEDGSAIEGTQTVEFSKTKTLLTFFKLLYFNDLNCSLFVYSSKLVYQFIT